ncbi:uncharacterized protein V6R79_007986 [Siganus canaliculatus]
MYRDVCAGSLSSLISQLNAQGYSRNTGCYGVHAEQNKQYQHSTLRIFSAQQHQANGKAQKKKKKKKKRQLFLLQTFEVSFTLRVDGWRHFAQNNSADERGRCRQCRSTTPAVEWQKHQNREFTGSKCNGDVFELHRWTPVVWAHVACKQRKTHIFAEHLPKCCKVRRKTQQQQKLPLRKEKKRKEKKKQKRCELHNTQPEFSG